jgi:hypothetical protein
MNVEPEYILYSIFHITEMTNSHIHGALTYECGAAVYDLVRCNTQRHSMPSAIPICKMPELTNEM